MPRDATMSAIDHAKRGLQDLSEKVLRQHVPTAVAGLLTDVLLDALLGTTEGRLLLLAALDAGGVHVATSHAEVVDERAPPAVPAPADPAGLELAAAARGHAARLRAALVGLVGIDGERELREMEAAIRVVPTCDEDKAVSLNAIHALLATVQGLDQ